MARFREYYKNEVVPRLMKEGGYKNVMQVPKIEKIVINIGLGEAIANAKALEAATGDLATITGQKPHVRRATKSMLSWSRREPPQISCHHASLKAATAGECRRSSTEASHRPAPRGWPAAR